MLRLFLFLKVYSQYSKTMSHKPIAILGFGREGRSIYDFLRKHPKHRKAEIWVLDRNTELTVPRGAKKQLGSDYLANLDRFAYIFRSPGIPLTLSELRAAAKKGVQISSSTRLFFEAAQKNGVLLIGVTGSKGKTTTSTLLSTMFKADKKKVLLAGNIGIPMLELLPKLKRGSWAILELSSFQLQDLDRSPHLAAVLDVFPEHQDAHGSLREYYLAKSNIARFQKKSDSVFYFPHNPVTRRVAAVGQGKKIRVTEKGFDLFRSDELHLPGIHMFRNAVMAATVARAAGINEQAIRRAALEFKGVEHRLEFVVEKPTSRGSISFFNDSASTNPSSSASAVLAFSARSHILIAGGYDKNLDYAPLATALKQAKTKLVILMGANRSKIHDAIGSASIPSCFAEDLTEAVLLAQRTAQDLPDNVAVIFSPGAASFDMFKNYADRGEQFRAACR